MLAGSSKASTKRGGAVMMMGRAASTAVNESMAVQMPSISRIIGFTAWSLNSHADVPWGVQSSM